VAKNLLRRTRVRSPAVQSRPVYERPGYRTLLGRIRENVRTYIRKQLELPRQEIAEILAANKRAAVWLGVAAVLAFMLLITLVVLLVALVALIPRDWLGVLVLALSVGAAFALFVVGFRAKAIVPALVGGIVLIAIGIAAFLWLPELVLAALLLTIALAIGTGAMGYGGYSRLELHGPTRTIKTVKETVQWAKQRLLGRSAS
jgi:Putative Actinobacterial Holin-X, holin superfamily III